MNSALMFTTFVIVWFVGVSIGALSVYPDVVKLERLLQESQSRELDCFETSSKTHQSSNELIIKNRKLKEDLYAIRGR